MTFEEEKKKALLEHRLSLKRIFIEKSLIATVLLIAALAGNFLVEKYKSDNTKYQFLLERKLLAASEIRQKYTDITSIYYRVSESSCYGENISSSELSSLKEKIQIAVEHVNKNSILLGSDYQNNTGKLFNLLIGISAEPQKDLCKYRHFVSDLSDIFSFELRKEIGFNEANKINFRPIPINPAEIDRIGVTGYLEKNYTHWKVSKK
ncbi:hypothetical protein ACQUQP_15140 [Marinobacterium sp. YM272]|uniref:hypothetical protein n=1 Tax=Marinobacterium sp. YM272 TaxID=3421654 RepID=UPI003D7F905E